MMNAEGFASCGFLIKFLKVNIEAVKKIKGPF
jgi:hypothetical protein